MSQNALGERLLEWLQRNREEMIQFVSELVLQESPSHDPEAQKPVFDLLEEGFVDCGLDISRRPGQSSGGIFEAFSRSSKSEPFQLLLGHCDTVWPHGTLEKMPLTRKENRLAGPGVFDMKSGLAHMVFALRALRALGRRPIYPVRVLINSDEEIGSRDSREAIRETARLAGRVFVLEPSAGEEGKLKTARKGIAQFTLRVTGKASHAGLAPEEGVSAILELAHQIQALWKMNDPEQGMTVNVGVIEGGLRANVVAPEALGKVDIRVISKEQLETVQQTISTLEPLLSGTSLRIEDWHSQPPLERAPRHRPLWDLARSASREIGLELGETLVGGGSDGNLTSQYAPTLDGLGAVGGGAHAEHEFIYLDRMLERTTLLALLLCRAESPS